MWDYILDRSLYDHPGATVTMRDSVRKWKDRPALHAGETVTIVRYKAQDGQYGIESRLLVANAAGQERWISAAAVTDLPEPHAIKVTS